MGSLFCYTTFRKDSFLGTNGVPMEVLAWEMKKKLVYALGLLALGLLAFYGLKLYIQGLGRDRFSSTTGNKDLLSKSNFFEITDFCPTLNHLVLGSSG